MPLARNVVPLQSWSSLPQKNGVHLVTNLENSVPGSFLFRRGLSFISAATRTNSLFTQDEGLGTPTIILILVHQGAVPAYEPVCPSLPKPRQTPSLYLASEQTTQPSQRKSQKP